MNTLVVYDSKFGNTEQIAKSIAASCTAFGQAQVARVDPTRSVELESVDVLIVGCPTQGFRPTPAMRAFLERLPREALGHLRVACFDTRVHMPWPLNGSAAQGMDRELRRRGVKPIIPPESFFVKGTPGPLMESEVERAAQWAVFIHAKYEALQPQVVAR